MTDLDTKIERLFGLIHEELRTLRDLVTLRFAGHDERLDGHDVRLTSHDERLDAHDQQLAEIKRLLQTRKA